METCPIELEIKTLRIRLEQLMRKKKRKTPVYIKLGTRFPLNEQQKRILDKLNTQPKRSIPLKELAIILNSFESHHTTHYLN